MAKTAAERQKAYRDKQRNSQEAMARAAGVTVPFSDCGTECNAQRTESVTRVTVEQATSVTPLEHSSTEAGQAHYLAHPDLYITRREPDKLNWGPWLDVAGLEQAGLKANRVAIPGDWDYEGTAIFIPGLPLSMPQEAIA